MPPTRGSQNAGWGEPSSIGSPHHPHLAYQPAYWAKGMMPIFLAVAIGNRYAAGLRTSSIFWILMVLGKLQ